MLSEQANYHQPWAKHNISLRGYNNEETESQSSQLSEKLTWKELELSCIITWKLRIQAWVF